MKWVPLAEHKVVHPVVEQAEEPHHAVARRPVARREEEHERGVRGFRARRVCPAQEALESGVGCQVDAAVFEIEQDWERSRSSSIELLVVPFS